MPRSADSHVDECRRANALTLTATRSTSSARSYILVLVHASCGSGRTCREQHGAWMEARSTTLVSATMRPGAALLLSTIRLRARMPLMKRRRMALGRCTTRDEEEVRVCRRRRSIDRAPLLSSPVGASSDNGSTIKLSRARPTGRICSHACACLRLPAQRMCEREHVNTGMH